VERRLVACLAQIGGDRERLLDREPVLAGRLLEENESGQSLAVDVLDLEEGDHLLGNPPDVGRSFGSGEMSRREIRLLGIVALQDRPASLSGQSVGSSDHLMILSGEQVSLVALLISLSDESFSRFARPRRDVRRGQWASRRKPQKQLTRRLQPMMTLTCLSNSSKLESIRFSDASEALHV